MSTSGILHTHGHPLTSRLVSGVAHSLYMNVIVQLSADALIAQKRAEIAAKIAAMKKAAPTAAAPAPSPSPVPTPTPPTPARTPAPATSSSASPAPGVSDDLTRRVAEAKRRVAEAQSKLAVKDNPYMVSHIVLYNY